MAKHLVLVGAGHAHLTTLKNLDLITGRGFRATVVSPDPFHYYSGMGPGMLSETYHPEEIRFHVKQTAEDRGGEFVEDSAVAIDPEARIVLTETGRVIPYDVVSFNTGSYAPHPEHGEKNPHETFLFPVKPIRNLEVAGKRLVALFEKKTPKVVVGGGGPAGVEIAANVKALAEKRGAKVDVFLVGGGALLQRFSPGFRKRAVRRLENLGIGILERDKIVGVADGSVQLLSGVCIQCDLALMALGVVPSPIFRNSGLPVGEDGGLLVNEYLQSVARPEIFGGGDCICFQPRRLDKAGVYAVRQNPFLLENLLNFLKGEPLAKFIPQRKYLLILNMGNGRGLLQWKGMAMEGRAVFALKNFIDKRFMKSFRK